MKILDIYAIQEMWKEDAKIDPDDLHNESLKIPELHAKYYEIYTNLLLLRKKCEEDKKQIRHRRYEYYTGKAEQDVYVGEPLDKKVRDKEHLQSCLNSDEEISRINIKIEIYEVSLTFLQDIIKMLHNRSFQIKNSIEAQKFISGQ
jgi:Recombination, repair and ssDNA binding protein UvsY